MSTAYTQQLQCSFNPEHNSSIKHYTEQSCKTKKTEEREAQYEVISDNQFCESFNGTKCL